MAPLKPSNLSLASRLNDQLIIPDVRYALRQLSRQPSFTLLATMTLALGIGLTTALFSVIDAAFLRPLPYPFPEQLVTLLIEDVYDGQPSRLAPSMQDIRAWRTVETVVSHAGIGRVGGFRPLMVDTGRPQRVIVAEASDGFLETYGVTPMLGRGFHVDDTRAGAPAVALLGHAYWRQEFGADPNVVGRAMVIEEQQVTIVGVLPAGFFSQTAVWQVIPFSAFATAQRGSGTPAIARLRPGVTLAQARAALDAVTPAALMRGPSPSRGRVVIESMYDDETGPYRPTIRALRCRSG
jgi:putative ABC transport system permease protein